MFLWSGSPIIILFLILNILSDKANGFLQTYLDRRQMLQA